MKQEYIFIGPPGSGKGTQTIMLSKETGFPHIDTGSLLREEIASGSNDGQIADSFISKGQLAPIELVARIIKNRLNKKDCENGFILDGYPRSLEQAYALDKILDELDGENKVNLKAFYFDVDENKLIERLVNRRSCEKCGAIYNLKTMNMQETDNCPKCGGKLIRRSDDTEEVARKRFDTYYNQTAPLIERYDKRGNLVRIDASLTIEEIHKNLTGAIKEHVNS